MLLRTMAATAFVCSSVAVTSQDAHDRAVIQLRDRTTVDGQIEGLAAGILVVRVSAAVTRRLPLSDVALIDRSRGASSMPETERQKGRSITHLLFLVDGSTVRGRLLAIRRSEGSGEDRLQSYIFRTFDGQEHSYEQSEVARVYLGTRPVESASGSASKNGVNR